MFHAYMNINAIKIFQINKNNFKNFSKTSLPFRANKEVKDSFEKTNSQTEFPLTKKWLKSKLRKEELYKADCFSVWLLEYSFTAFS